MWLPAIYIMGYSGLIMASDGEMWPGKPTHQAMEHHHLQTREESKWVMASIANC